MRKYLFIFGAVLAYLLLSSRSCDGPEQGDDAAEEVQLVQTKERIIDEFESGELSSQQLRAFEVKAEQKLTDLADYLSIYTDQTMDESFKSQARQMIRELFITDSVRINALLPLHRGGENLLIDDFLSKVLALDYDSINYIFDSIEIDKPLRISDESDYSGILTFYSRVKACSSSDTLDTGQARMEVGIIASRVKKSFGTDTLSVWGVFLGNIKPKIDN